MNRRCDFPSFLQAKLTLTPPGWLRRADTLAGEAEAWATAIVTLNPEGAPRTIVVTSALRGEGKTVTTLEGVDADERERFANAFASCGGLQCGYCIPGIVMRAKAQIDKKGAGLERDDMARHLGAHLCRCTGYVKVLDAIEAVALGKDLVPEPLGGGGLAGSLLGGVLARERDGDVRDQVLGGLELGQDAVHVLHDGGDPVQVAAVRRREDAVLDEDKPVVLRLQPVGRPGVPEHLVGDGRAVIEAVEGPIFWNGALPGMTPEQRRATYEAMISTLARLHGVEGPAQCLERVVNLPAGPVVAGARRGQFLATFQRNGSCATARRWSWWARASSASTPLSPRSTTTTRCSICRRPCQASL